MRISRSGDYIAQIRLIGGRVFEKLLECMVSVTKTLFCAVLWGTTSLAPGWDGRPLPCAILIHRAWMYRY